MTSEYRYIHDRLQDGDTCENSFPLFWKSVDELYGLTLEDYIEENNLGQHIHQTLIDYISEFLRDNHDSELAMEIEEDIMADI